MAATLPSVDSANIIITNITSPTYVIERRSLTSTVAYTLISYQVTYTYVGTDDTTVYLQLITQVSTAVASGGFTAVLHTMATINNAITMIYASCIVVPTFSPPTVAQKNLPLTNAPTTSTHAMHITCSLDVTLELSLGLGLPLLMLFIAMIAAYRRRVGLKAPVRPLPPQLMNMFEFNKVFEASAKIEVPDSRLGKT